VLYEEEVATEKEEKTRGNRTKIKRGTTIGERGKR